jgi:hypothetical protein
VTCLVIPARRTPVPRRNRRHGETGSAAETWRQAKNNIGPGRALGRKLALNDLPSREEEERSDAWPGFDEGVLDARDRALCQELERLAAGAGPVTRRGLLGSGAYAGRDRLAAHASWLPHCQRELDNSLLKP